MEGRAQELGETGKGKLGLRIDPSHLEHPHLPGPASRVTQQGALADPFLAPHDEGTALTASGGIEQQLDASTLNLASDGHTPNGRSGRVGERVGRLR